MLISNIRPAPNGAVEHMGLNFFVAHLHAPVQRARDDDASDFGPACTLVLDYFEEFVDLK